MNLKNNLKREIEQCRLTEALTTKLFLKWEPRESEIDLGTGDWKGLRIRPSKDLGIVRVLGERGFETDEKALGFKDRRAVEAAEQAIFVFPFFFFFF